MDFRLVRLSCSLIGHFLIGYKSPMHYSKIKNHLKPYAIVVRRKTTINHAFASAVAPNDEYVPELVKSAMRDLGQNPENLRCVYCDEPAETWDHVFATVKDKKFSGYGHRLGNLLPCCKPCNSAKGNKNWRAFIEGRCKVGKQERIAAIDVYLAKYLIQEIALEKSPEHVRLEEIKTQVLNLLAEADGIAKKIRDRNRTPEARKVGVD